MIEAYDKKNLALLGSIITFAAVFLIAGTSEQHAYADILLPINGLTCEDSYLGGTWDEGTNTCFLASLILDDDIDLEVESGVNVLITTNATVNIGAERSIFVASGGTLDIDGGKINILGDGTLANSGMLIVSDVALFGTGIHNFGTITNSGTLTLSLSNNIGIHNQGTINNTATLNINFSGDGIAIRHDGTFDNSGTITINNINGQYCIQMGSGTFNNLGIITIENSADECLYIGAGTFNNYGGITAQGSGGGATDMSNIAGTIYNYGTITLDSGSAINNFGTINSYGTININSGATLHTPGTITVFCGGTLNNNGGTIFGTVTYEDCPPVITILGDNPATVLLGLPYSDAGVTVTDDNDPNPALTTVGTVNTAVAGTYTVTYTAEDDAGNESTATRTVNVITAAGATQSLIDNINSQVTDKNVKSSLLGPLKEAQKILNDKNTSNDGAACDKLANFIANVDSKEASGKLSSTLAQQYRDGANAIRSSLGC